MDSYDILIDYLVPVVMVIFFSFAASYNYRNRSFSTNTFMCAISIGILVLVWIGVLLFYFGIFSGLIVVSMLIRKGSVYDE